MDVASVITAYAEAGIPLETMWTDIGEPQTHPILTQRTLNVHIDYMDRRRIFTVDPDYFPMDRMREIVQYLHDHNQKYIVMTDPAVAYTPDEDYGSFHRGTDMDVWMKTPEGEYQLGIVWPGATVYPDWFHPDIQQYWSNEFALFYSADEGLDIDGAWIDMNDPVNVSACNSVWSHGIVF